MRKMETYRPEIYSTKYVASSSSIYSSLSGARILKEGGTVGDAAISMSAVLAVTQNNLCGLGGDSFIMGRTGEDIFVINGSGKSSRNARADIFLDRGLKNIPARGPLSAINIPGLVKSWIDLWNKNGTMEFRDLLADAINLAENGFPVTQNYVNSVNASYYEGMDSEWIKIFNPGQIRAGDLLIQKDLSRTLKTISEDPESFYSGELADKIVEGFRDKGIVIDEIDMKDHRSLMQNPLHVDFSGHTIYETPPNSQGSTLLVWLRLYEEYGGGNLRKFFKAGLESMEFRRSMIGDPEMLQLDQSYFQREPGRNKNTVSGISNYREKEDGDTTYFTVANSEGDIISMIQSNYMGFGSLIIPSGTGFIMQNRGSYFSLDRKNHNFLEPQKRTFHTLAACIGMKDGLPAFSLGTMGGDVQPQVHALLIKNMVENGMKAQKSVEEPRAVFPGTIYESSDTLYFEEGFRGVEEIQDLFRSIKKIPYGDSRFGHAQVIRFLENGVLNGGADLRGDGYSIPGM